MSAPPPYQEYDSEKLKPMDIDVKSVSSNEFISEEGPTLHIYSDSWTGRDGKVYASDKKTVLYEIANRNRKPQLTVREPSTQATIATLEFHTWSRKMDADIRGNQFRLGTSKACWKSVDVQYDSPAFSQTMRWKRQTIWMMLNTTLVDSNGIEVARFEPIGWAKRKIGRVQLLQSGLNQEQIDEIVFTALSVWQDTTYYTAQQAGTAASVNSSAAAAAAS